MEPNAKRRGKKGAAIKNFARAHFGTALAPVLTQSPVRMECVSNIFHEFVMSASFKITRVAESAAHLRHHRLALSGIIALTLALLLGSTVLTPAALQIFAASSAKDHADLNRTSSASIWEGSPWAGGLESPRPEGQATNARQPEPPVTSASYTSGFDEKAVGLGPLPATAQSMKLAQPRDPRACPDDLNCSFRPAKAGGIPPRRPLAAANVEPVKASPPPTGLALLTANLHLPAHLPAYLPSANTLLKPFTFVGDTVVGFVKKL